MTILADDIAAISSYNDGIVVETSPMTTALEQYWAARKRICDETVGQLQQSSTDVDAERAWDYFCTHHTPFLREYLKRSVNDLGAPLRRLWGWHFGLIREARRAFLRNARVELWIPFAYSPLTAVRVPGKTGKYDEVEWPDDDGKQYGLGKPIVAVHWGSDAFFMILPSGAYVNFKTFAYTKNGVTWNMQEALPKAFVRQLTGFQPELQFAEERFAALRASWDKKNQLTRATASSRRIEQAAESWSLVHIPERQKLDILRRAELFERNDAAAPRGLLLTGPPGTGKTFVARALREMMGCDFQMLSLADLKQQTVGASGKRVREVWDRARKRQPAIIFIDECEGILGRRGAAETDAFATDIVHAFLAEWDGIRGSAQVWVIGATNRRDMLDDAILSRFGWEVELQLPGAEDRRQILSQEVKALGLSVDVPQEAAALTQGMSGRDLKQLAQSVRSVAYPAEPTQEHFLNAIGAARKSHNTKVDRKAGWETLVLDDAILDRLKLVCVLLRDTEKWQAQGVSIPRSLLLAGPSGVGKTQVARTLANESGLTFIAATTADVKANYLGQSGNRVKLLFERARSCAPAILFLDELDVIVPDRAAAGGNDQLTDEIVGQLLQEMDGISARDSHVFLVAASNHLERIDAAVRSRFQERLIIPLPDRNARIRLLANLLAGKKIGFPLNEGTVLLADQTKDQALSGRDLEGWVQAAEQKALLRALRDGGPENFAIGLEDFGGQFQHL
jgi:SpoVK/Ycf46/Vps4 family AAA+-type ATPase